MTREQLMKTPPEGYRVLGDPDSFHWRKAELDLAMRYQHLHNGKPEAYPCAVISHFRDDPNGPYNFDHSFMYPHKEEITCECCKTVLVTWRWEAREANQQ